jgi:hypothetical protein
MESLVLGIWLLPEISLSENTVYQALTRETQTCANPLFTMGTVARSYRKETAECSAQMFLNALSSSPGWKLLNAYAQEDQIHRL